MGDPRIWDCIYQTDYKGSEERIKKEIENIRLTYQAMPAQTHAGQSTSIAHRITLETRMLIEKVLALREKEKEYFQLLKERFGCDGDLFEFLWEK